MRFTRANRDDTCENICSGALAHELLTVWASGMTQAFDTLFRHTLKFWNRERMDRVSTVFQETVNRVFLMQFSAAL